jgi:hydroxylamine dehydrogenase
VIKRYLFAVFVLVFPAQVIQGADVPISDDTEACLECHISLHSGIVEGWKKSRHAQITPGEAMKVTGLGQKVSNKDIPLELRDVVLGCAECHALRADAHADSFEHNGYEIHTVVSPKDCAVCHTQEARQFENNLMAHAYGNLMGNGVYQLLVRSINGVPELKEGKVVLNPANEATEAESCLYCHGTKLELTGTVTRETDYGEMEFPVIEGWPNQGTGRINLDGSLGACSACHTRHQFSIEMARKPYTCMECHVGPDVPAYKVYTASKHGNIFSAHNKDWDFKPVPWTLGSDFTAPTCAACHVSLLVNTEGEVITQRTHEVKNRLPWRIFGLIYAHPHPREADTTTIKNKQGLQLPTDFDGGFATEYLLNEQERAESRNAMQATCLACHHRSWVDNHWSRLLNTIEQTNAATVAGTRIMADIWKRGLAVDHTKGGNPFDEYIERVWSDVWLFHANSVRFASSMGGGGDYGVFAGGRYHLTKSVRELHDWFELRVKERE